MRKYPLPLNSGKECLILEGFGDKICKLIDDRLKTFLQEGGILHEDISSIDVEDEDPNPLKNTKKTNKKAIRDFHDDQDDEEDIASLDFISHSKTSNSSRPLLNLIPKKNTTIPKKNNITEESHDESNSKSSQATGKKTKVASGKEYIPSFRSGPYAILVALVENQKSDVNFCTKINLFFFIN